MNKTTKTLHQRRMTVFFGLLAGLILGGCSSRLVVPLDKSGTLALTPPARMSATPAEAALPPSLPTPIDPEAEDVSLEMTPAALRSQPTHAPGGTSKAAGHTSFCGRTDAITILILGVDEHAQADAIRLARIDFSEGKIRIVSVPRDFYVSIVGFEDYGIQAGRINATFGYGEFYQGAGSGAEALAQNLTHNFGVEVDHQFVLRFSEIAAYVDAIGGVEVVLDKAVSDSGNYFPAGSNFLDGERAVAFMRVREYDSDFRRIDRQTVVFKALLDKIRAGLSTANVLNLALTLFKENSTQSDLSMRDFQSLYCLSRAIDQEQITVSAIPPEMFHTYITPNGGWVLIPHGEVPGFIQNSLFGAD